MREHSDRVLASITYDDIFGNFEDTAYPKLEYGVSDLSSLIYFIL